MNPKKVGNFWGSLIYCVLKFTLAIFISFKCFLEDDECALEVFDF